MKAGKLLPALFALLLLCQLPHSWPLWGQAFFTSTIETCAADTAINPYGWVVLSLVAVLMGAMINAGSQVLGGAFNTPKYQEFLHGHLWALLECAVLLSVLAAAIIGLGNFGGHNIDAARAYAVLIRNTVMMDFGAVLMANTASSLFTNVNPTIRPGTLGGIYISFQVAPMFRPIYDALGMLMQMLVTSIVQWYAQDYILCASKGVMLTLLIPAGLFLRAYGLKAGGNALVGIALALYFIYPFMIMQIGQAVTVHMANELQPQSAEDRQSQSPSALNTPIICFPSAVQYNKADSTDVSIPNGDQTKPQSSTPLISAKSIINGPVSLDFSGQKSLVSTGRFCAFNTMLPSLWSTISGSWSNLGLGSLAFGIGTYALLKWLNISFISVALLVPLVTFVQMAGYETVYFLFIISAILPIFVVFITITMSREIAKVLGTEIDLSALEKLI